MNTLSGTDTHHLAGYMQMYEGTDNSDITLEKMSYLEEMVRVANDNREIYSTAYHSEVCNLQKSKQE